MAEYFTLPAGAASSTLAYMAEITTGYWELIALAVAIPLGFYVIRRVMGLFPGR